MNVIASAGNPDLAMVYLAEVGKGKYIEMVESLQPPFPKADKWVLIVSTLLGCPVGCSICDAGGWYDGLLSTKEILSQVDYLVTKYFPNREIPVKKFKIQFARMGEPVLNPHVLEVLEALPGMYKAPGLMPCLSTIAPHGRDEFFKRLADIKQTYYGNGNFQLQFSIHSTDNRQRDQLMPIKKWGLEKIATYGERFYCRGDRKITLNFALAKDSLVSVGELVKHFDPEFFMIKITPVNPTINAYKNKKVNAIHAGSSHGEPGIVSLLRGAGYDVIISIGELEENKIGSNCGQYVKRFLDHGQDSLEESYQYPLEHHVTRGASGSDPCMMK